MKIMKRVTADLDYNKLKSFYYFSKAFFSKYNWYSIEIRKSPNNHKNKGKGFHLIVWFKGVIPKMKLRKRFGDDKNRMRIDRMHRQNKQFLFISKQPTTLQKEFWHLNKYIK